MTICVELLKEIDLNGCWHRIGDMIEVDRETNDAVIIDVGNGVELHLKKGIHVTVMSPKLTTMYLHGCKESSYETAKELGLSDGAVEKFRHALYEVEFDLEIYPNGTYKILEVREGSQELRPVDAHQLRRP